MLSHTGIQQGSALRIVLQATTALPTGRYNAQIEVVAPVSGVNQLQTLSQTITVEDRSSSAFGQGWSLSELERVVPQTGGNLLVSGTGVREWFDSTGMPMPGMMSNSALVQQANMTWRLNLPDGGLRTYDTTGRITSKVDGYGNTISFVWNSTSGLLTSDTDAVGRAATLTYHNGRLSRVTVAAGRFVDLAHNATGRLLTITDPAATQPGTGTTPLMTYTYNSSGLIATLTDVQQRQTVLTYSFAGRLAQATLPGGAQWQFAPVAAVGLVNTASGLGTTTNPAPIASPTTAEATWTNPLGGIRKLKVDSLGNVIRKVLPNDGTTTYTWDGNGRVLSVTQPDPDGTGPLASPITTSVYDTSGNRTQLTLPGGATRSWSYNSQNSPD